MLSEPDDDLAEVVDDGAEQTYEEIAGSQDRGDKPILILDAQTWRHVRSTNLLRRLHEMAEQEPLDNWSRMSIIALCPRPRSLLV